MASDERYEEASLDDLCRMALGGDLRAQSVFFEDLHVRFDAVATRRVTRDDVQDVVQEALSIVHSRCGDRRAGGVLPWAFAVLRNVIGNYYRRRSTRDDRERQGLDIDALAVEPTEGDDETIPRVRDALARLASVQPRCALLFRCILESHERGGGPREVSARAWRRVQSEIPDMTRNGFYVTLHRCRNRLRDLLREQERTDA